MKTVRETVLAGLAVGVIAINLFVDTTTKFNMNDFDMKIVSVETNKEAKIMEINHVINSVNAIDTINADKEAERICNIVRDNKSKTTDFKDYIVIYNFYLKKFDKNHFEYMFYFNNRAC